MYEDGSTDSGNSVMAISNLPWMALSTSSLSSDETKVMASPLVPKRPARLRAGWDVSEGEAMEGGDLGLTRHGEGTSRRLRGCRS